MNQARAPNIIMAEHFIAGYNCHTIRSTGVFSGMLDNTNLTEGHHGEFLAEMNN